MAKGKLFVVSGASGVGKSTVLSKVMKSREDLRFSVSDRRSRWPELLFCIQGKVSGYDRKA